MNEKEILDLLKESSEDIVVPDSLLPENIEKRLEKQPAPKGVFTGKVRVLSEIAAACCVLIVGGTIYENYGHRMAKTAENAAVMQEEVLFDAEEAETEKQPDEENPVMNTKSTDSMSRECVLEKEEKDSVEYEEAVEEDACMAEEAFDMEECEEERKKEMPENMVHGFTVPGAEEELYEMLVEAEKNSDEYMVKNTDSFSWDGNSGEIELENGSPVQLLEGAEGDKSVPSYSDTNVREAGVEEGDLVKTDGNVIYILKERKQVDVIGVKDNMKYLTSLTLADPEEFIEDMYLDEGKLSLIISGKKKEENGKEASVTEFAPYCGVEVWDVKEPEDAAVIGRSTQEGTYLTSRKQGDEILLITSFVPELSDDCRKSHLLPKVGETPLLLEDIYLPEKICDIQYLVVSVMDQKNPDQFLDHKAIVSGTNCFYVSNQAIYILNREWGMEPDLKEKTDILKISYQGGAIYADAMIRLPGYVKDDFSLDEYRGYLRVLVTEEKETLTNSLFVLDETLTITGELRNLAEGELIKSVRFMGDVGYVVTFQRIDPLFGIDLSDPKEPKVRGELKIPGFSAYLHPFGSERLLGVGYDVEEETGSVTGIKVSMFNRKDPFDVSVEQEMIIDDAYSFPAEYDHRAILVSYEKNLIGFVCGTDYVLLSYMQDTGFTVHLREKLTENPFDPELDHCRGVFTGDQFIMIYGNEIRSYDMTQSFVLADKLVCE